MEMQILLAIQNLRNPLLDKFFVAITHLGDGGGIWIVITGILMMRRSTRPVGWMCIVALLLTGGIGNLIIKPLVGRARPIWLHPTAINAIPVPKDFSFPSGHTMASFAVAIILLRNVKSPWGMAAMVLAGLIAFSRIYLFVHYPSDVIAGILLGAVFALGGEVIGDKWFSTIIT